MGSNNLQNGDLYRTLPDPESHTRPARLLQLDWRPHQLLTYKPQVPHTHFTSLIFDILQDGAQRDDDDDDAR